MATLEYGVAARIRVAMTHVRQTPRSMTLWPGRTPPPRTPTNHTPCMHPSHSTNWKLTVDVQNVYKMVSPGLHASLRA